MLFKIAVVCILIANFYLLLAIAGDLVEIYNKLVDIAERKDDVTRD